VEERIRALLLRKVKGGEVNEKKGKKKGFAGPMSNCFLRACLDD